MRTEESTRVEIERLSTRQKELATKPNRTIAELNELMTIEGKKDALRQIADEQSVIEAEELRGAAKRAVPIMTEETSRANSEFRTYLRTGENRSGSMGDTSAFTVPEPLVKDLVDAIYSQSPIYANARVFKLDAGQSPVLHLPIKTAHSTVTWAASDVATRNESTAPQFAQVKVEALDIYDYCFASQTLLDSSDMESIILEDLAGSIMQGMNAKFCTGTGSNEPAGIFVNASGDNAYTSVASGSNDVLVAAKIIEAFYTLPAQHQQNAKWYCKPATLSTIAQMSRGTTLTTHPLVEYATDGSARILGKPVVLVDDAPAIGDGLYPLAYGDLSKAYAIVEHKSFSVLRNPFEVPFVRFYGLTRINGTPWDSSAMILCKSDT